MGACMRIIAALGFARGAGVRVAPGTTHNHEHRTSRSGADEKRQPVTGASSGTGVTNQRRVGWEH